jgi:hypothetical protein
MKEGKAFCSEDEKHPDPVSHPVIVLGELPP